MEMDLTIITIFYCGIMACTFYPPTEFITAGFTIPQIFEGILGSENQDFMLYHVRRIGVTILVQTVIPLGYLLTLYLGGWRSEWLIWPFLATSLCVLLVIHKITYWWENMKIAHPVLNTLLPYVTEERDWNIVARDFNTEFKNLDKVSIQLSHSSKLVATQNWLIKVSLYRVDIVKQAECSLVATTTDSHNLTMNGEAQIQFVNIKVIPTRSDVRPFSFRICIKSLRDLQGRLANPIRVPDHLTLVPTLIEKFIIVFKEVVKKNSVYVVPDTEEREQCIGCMQAQADVKIQRSCLPPPARLVGGPPQCQTCNCRVQWCISCMARWWAARSRNKHTSQWLSGRCSCPLCRATFCMLDVHLVSPPPPSLQLDSHERS